MSTPENCSTDQTTGGEHAPPPVVCTHDPASNSGDVSGQMTPPDRNTETIEQTDLNPSTNNDVDGEDDRGVENANAVTHDRHGSLDPALPGPEESQTAMSNEGAPPTEPSDSVLPYANMPRGVAPVKRNSADVEADSDSHSGSTSILRRYIRNHEHSPDGSLDPDEPDSGSGNVPDPREQVWAEFDLSQAAPWFVAKSISTDAQILHETPKVTLYQKASVLNPLLSSTTEATEHKKDKLVPYQLYEGIFDDLSTKVAANLRSRVPTEGRILIRCPADNGQFFVEAVVHLLAKRLGASLISFGLQDLADLKDLSQVERRRDLLEALPFFCGTEHKIEQVKLSSGSIYSLQEFDLSDHLERLFLAMAECVGANLGDHSTCLSLIDTAHRERGGSEVIGPATSPDPRSESPRPTIFYLKGFRDFVSHEVEGARDILYFLQKAVNFRRAAGNPTIWIGGDCSSKTFRGGVCSGSRWIDRSPFAQVTPPGSATQRAVLAADMPRWNLESNIRLLKRAMRRSSACGGVPTTAQVPESPSDRRGEAEDEDFRALADVLAEWDLRDKGMFQPLLVKLEEGIWSSEYVFNVVQGIRGRLPKSGPVSEEDVAKAVATLESSCEENNEQASRFVPSDDQPRVPETSSTDTEPVPEDILSNALGPINDENSYLQCVKDGLVKPGAFNIHFDQVIVDPRIKDAAKRLIRLSIQGQRDYAYGVLRSHRAPGVLLYGPPGTGKTMLAKAVATEANCVTMEVSGAQVLQSKVGQSEKIIEVVFTAARSLSKHWPCVIFLDEADSVLVRRTEKTNSWERSMVNQFLHEWDKLMGTLERTFVIVSTNRPQDIDEAILRRLPQRLHIGLPGSDDRCAILKHYLKEEIKDSEVNLDALASFTPGYSGSDLKNICLYAALHATEEQMAKPSTTRPGLARPKRVLKREHFVKALGDVRPCVSKAMLSDIRKFETMYGPDMVQMQGFRRKLGMFGSAGAWLRDLFSQSQKEG